MSLPAILPYLNNCKKIFADQVLCPTEIISEIIKIDYREKSLVVNLLTYPLCRWIRSAYASVPQQ